MHVMHVSVYIYMCVCVCVCIYIYIFTHNSHVQIFYFPSASQLSGDGEHWSTCSFSSMLIHKVHDNFVLFIFFNMEILLKHQNVSY